MTKIVTVTYEAISEGVEGTKDAVLRAATHLALAKAEGKQVAGIAWHVAALFVADNFVDYNHMQKLGLAKKPGNLKDTFGEAMANLIAAAGTFKKNGGKLCKEENGQRMVIAKGTVQKLNKMKAKEAEVAQVEAEVDTDNEEQAQGEAITTPVTDTVHEALCALLASAELRKHYGTELSKLIAATLSDNRSFMSVKPAMQEEARELEAA